MDDATAGRPIFVVGSARSGTSALGGALSKWLGRSGPAEGHFLGVLTKLIPAANAWFEKYDGLPYTAGVVNDVDRTAFIDDLVRAAGRALEDAYGGRDFVDKTPDPDGIRPLRHAKKIWPDVAVIYLQRRGIEVVRSRMEKFPDVPFENHCNLWVSCLREWRSTRLALRDMHRAPGPPFLEIEHLDMQVDSATVAEKVSTYLGRQSRARELAELFRSEFPQSTHGRVRAVTSLEDVGWEDTDVRAFLEICGACMQQENYSLTESYFLNRR